MAELLSIRRVAEETGLAAGTIRMWEQRYGFPEPQRTASGYRKFYEDDIRRLQWVLRQQKERFLPLKVIKAKLDAGEDLVGDAPLGDEGDQPSLFG